MHLSKSITLLTVFIAMLLGCCGRQPEKDKNFHSIPNNSSASEEKIPTESLLEPTFKGKLRSVSQLNQLLRPEKIIRLETTDDSIIGSIYDVVYTKDFWIILDTIQHRVLKFSSDGAYRGLIGRTGKGPGEYIQPDSIELCYEGNIAVYDGAQGVIHVYNINGEHQFTTELNSDKTRIHARSAFVWESKYRLYLFGFPSANPSTPWHVIVDPFSESAPFEVITGFGERFEPYMDKGLPTWMYSAVAVVGDKLWTGSPYSNMIDVFDFEGRYVGQLGQKSDPNAPRKEDHDLKNRKEVRALLKEKNFNIRFCVVGPLVLNFQTKSVNLYDFQGNRLTPPLKAGNLSFPLTSFSKDEEYYMVTSFFIFNTKDEYSLGDQELMVRAGFNLDDFSNENMGLYITKLVL